MMMPSRTEGCRVRVWTVVSLGEKKQVSVFFSGGWDKSRCDPGAVPVSLLSEPHLCRPFGYGLPIASRTDPPASALL